MPTQDEVLAALQACTDPELPVNIVDLGLVQEVEIKNGSVKVKITLTAPGCPIHSDLPQQVKQALLKLEGVETVTVEVVNKGWTPERLSNRARRILGYEP